jgi:putative membrane protein
MDDLFAFFVPWEFSWLVQAAVWGSLWVYVRGLRRMPAPPGFGPRLAFVVGLLGFYLVTQTRFDYWSQYMFFVHRGQHLVLHHLAPFLVALAAPAAVLAAGLPAPLKAWWRRQHRLGQALRRGYTWLQQPVVACTLFVGLIYFWLTPEVHFDAMLSERLYWLMNASMALDGLLFWWLMLERHGHGPTPRLGFGLRILLLAAIMPPQIVLGAKLAFSDVVWFDVYAVCGRAWPLDPLTDQQLGGLLTWIPASMMSVVAALVLLRFMLHDSAARPAIHKPLEQASP